MAMGMFAGVAWGGQRFGFQTIRNRKNGNNKDLLCLAVVVALVALVALVGGVAFL